MSSELLRLVGDVRVTAQAFRELFLLLEEKDFGASGVDCLGLVLCNRLEDLGAQLEAGLSPESVPTL